MCEAIDRSKGVKKPDLSAKSPWPVAVSLL